MSGPSGTKEAQQINEGCRLLWYHWAIVISIDMLGPFSTDSYIPNMAQLQHDLQASSVVVGYSLQVNSKRKSIVE